MCAVWCVHSCVKDPHASALWERPSLPHGEAQGSDQAFLWQSVNIDGMHKGLWIIGHFFPRPTNCSFLLGDKNNLRVLSYRHLLQRLPNPPSWAVYRKYAEVLRSCVVGVTPSGSDGPPDSSVSAHAFVHSFFISSRLQSDLQELIIQNVADTWVYLLGLWNLQVFFFSIVVHFESNWTLQTRSLAFI